MISPSKAPFLLIAVAALIAIIALLVPPMPQPQDYHNFRDHRGWLGIPNFGDVASNVPFAIVGIWGLVFLVGMRGGRFPDPRQRWFYEVMFAGLILTAVGSAYYHLAPDNDRLVWDRIPIMVVFMVLLAAVIAERVGIGLGLALFPVLETAGIGSVLVWRGGELQSHGDLRFYAAVQVYAILILLLALLFPPKYTAGRRLRRSGRLLCSRQDFGRVRSAGLCLGARRQRTHLETPCCRNGGLLDLKNVAEARFCS